MGPTCNNPNCPHRLEAEELRRQLEWLKERLHHFETPLPEPGESLQQAIERGRNHNRNPVPAGRVYWRPDASAFGGDS